MIKMLPKIYEDAAAIWEAARPAKLELISEQDAQADFSSRKRPETGRGTLITGENISIAKALIENAEKEKNSTEKGKDSTPQLIYMDPPFFTGRKHNAVLKDKSAAGEKTNKSVMAFNDSWSSGAKNAEEAFVNYLTMLTARIFAAHELIAADGSFWLHLDFHAAAYAKILADEVFGGSKYMVNEIIWNYKSGGSSSRRFARKHDNLLFYVKDPKKYKFYATQEKSYNRGRKPYRFKGVKEYRDEGGWYTMVNMRDVWQIDMVGRTSAERTGYATQKPEELISRIIESCTDEGDLCADLFGGSGTLAAAAEKLGRRWISCDQNPLATEFAASRLSNIGAAFDILG